MNKKLLFIIFSCAFASSLLESKGPPKENPKKRKHSFLKFSLNYEEDVSFLKNDTVADKADEIITMPS